MSFDWELTLTRCNDNPKIAQELIQLLSNDIPVSEGVLREAQRNNDTQKIHDELHKLKGSCAYVGMPELRELIDATEKNIEQQQLDNLSNELALIYAELEVIQKDLVNYI